MKDEKKCSNKNHLDINAIDYCIECNLYLCKKCLNYHLELFESHHIINSDRNKNEIFTGLCLESNHRIELNFYCKTHNQLCCGACLSKIKNEGTGHHFDCNVCPIGEIKNEKKNILDKNIELLEELLGTIENSINELKKINETINEKKEELKLNISKIFTKIRNTINDREDEILLEVDKIFDETYFREEFIKNSEKLPSEIKISLEKGNNIKKEWDNNEIKLNSKINDCISIENTIKNIYKLRNVIGKSKKVKIQFLPDDEGINKFLEEIIKFGELDIIFLEKIL